MREPTCARSHGVDPNDADIVYFWADLREAQSKAMPDQLWVSGDAGATWTKIVAGAGDLSGFALSPDGMTVAVSGPEDGLLMAPSADVVSKGADAFTQTFDGKVWGLSWLDTGLFAGNDDFTEGDLPKFTYGVSTDDGKSFSGLLEICDVTMADCAADSIAGKICPDKLNMPGGFDEDMIHGDRCVPDAPSDDGTTGDAGTGTGSTDGGGCSCRAVCRAARSHSPTWWGVTLAAALGVAARRRRRRARVGPPTIIGTWRDVEQPSSGFPACIPAGAHLLESVVRSAPSRGRPEPFEATSVQRALEGTLPS